MGQIDENNNGDAMTTHDIVIGHGRVPAVVFEDANRRQRSGWALPGGVKTTDVDQARRAAEIINQEIERATR